MYIWGIFLMLGCLAKSSQACSYVNYDSWNKHLEKSFNHGFSGCEGHEFGEINLLNLVEGVFVSLDKLAIVALSIESKGKGLWELDCELSAHLGCKGITGSVLSIKLNGQLQLGFDKGCGCQKFIIVKGSLGLFISVLNAPLVDLELLGILQIITGSLKTKIAGTFTDTLSVLLKETLTTTCHSVVGTINLELQSISEKFSYLGQSWSYKATSLEYTDYGCVTSWSLVNEVTGLAIALAGGLSLDTISGLTSSWSGGSILSDEFLSSFLSIITEFISELTYIVKDFLALGIFTQITGEVTVAYNQISHECTSNADGTWLTQKVELKFLEAGKTFLIVTVTLKKTLELVTGGSQIWIKQGISEIIETIVTFGGENCGCPDESILGILEEILLKLIQYIDNEQGCNDKQSFPNPQPGWVNGDSHNPRSCSSYDNCISCS